MKDTDEVIMELHELTSTTFERINETIAEHSVLTKKLLDTYDLCQETAQLQAECLETIWRAEAFLKRHPNFKLKPPPQKKWVVTHFEL